MALKQTLKEINRHGRDLINTPDNFAYAFKLVPKWCKIMLIAFLVVDVVVIYFLATC